MSDSELYKVIPGTEFFTPSAEKNSFQNFTAELHRLMHDKTFLIEVAKNCDAAYRERAQKNALGSGKEIEDWMMRPLLSDKEEALLKSGEGLLNDKAKDSLEAEMDQADLTIQRAREIFTLIKLDRQIQKIEMKFDQNKAGFVAAQEALGIIAQERHLNPFQLIQDVADNKPIPVPIQKIFMRLAHATWYVTAHFRNRETTDMVKPFDELTEEVQLLDWDQTVAVMRTMRANLDNRFFAAV
jgi:hypothetical protein